MAGPNENGRNDTARPQPLNPPREGTRPSHPGPAFTPGGVNDPFSAPTPLYNKLQVVKVHDGDVQHVFHVPSGVPLTSSVAPPPFDEPQGEGVGIPRPSARERALYEHGGDLWRVALRSSVLPPPPAPARSQLDEIDLANFVYVDVPNSREPLASKIGPPREPLGSTLDDWGVSSDDALRPKQGPSFISFEEEPSKEASLRDADHAHDDLPKVAGTHSGAPAADDGVEEIGAEDFFDLAETPSRGHEEAGPSVPHPAGTVAIQGDLHATILPMDTTPAPPPQRWMEEPSPRVAATPTLTGSAFSAPAPAAAPTVPTGTPPARAVPPLTPQTPTVVGHGAPPAVVVSPAPPAARPAPAIAAPPPRGPGPFGPLAGPTAAQQATLLLPQIPGPGKRRTTSHHQKSWVRARLHWLIPIGAAVLGLAALAASISYVNRPRPPAMNDSPSDVSVSVAPAPTEPSPTPEPVSPQPEPAPPVEPPPPVVAEPASEPEPVAPTTVSAREHCATMSGGLNGEAGNRCCWLSAHGVRRLHTAAHATRHNVWVRTDDGRHAIRPNAQDGSVMICGEGDLAQPIAWRP